MDRRDFLGSVIGTSLSLPFLARLVMEPLQQAPLLPYMIGFRDQVTGYVIQAPRVETIVAVEGGFEFTAAPLWPTARVQLSHLLLYTADGQLVSNVDFSKLFHMMPGDVFNAKLKLVADVPLSLERLVNEMICRPNNRR